MNEIVSIARDALIEGKTSEVIAIAEELHESFDDALDAFVAELNRVASDPKYGHCYSTGERMSSFELDAPGKRFVRVVEIHWAGKDCNEVSQRSVQCFVELSNGYIWKAASWKKPAPNFPRGNVFDPESRKKIAERFYGVPSEPYHKELR